MENLWLEKDFFSKTHSQREYEECIASVLCRQKFPFDKVEMKLFTPEESARAGYFMELVMKIAMRCNIKSPEFLSDLLTIARQKVENSNLSNIPLFEQPLPGTTYTLGRRWRLSQELILKNVEDEVKRWMIRYKKDLKAAG